MRLILLLMLPVLVTACGTAGQLYRLPYTDGTEVTIVVDHTDHSTPTAEMIDMRATQPNQVLVAAAEGWIREIKDSATTNVSSDPQATNNYVWIEHPLDYCQPPQNVRPGGITTGQSDCRSCPEGLGRCNEWTLYAHMAPGSVTGNPPTGAGLVIDQWVEAGTPIGIESNIGFAPCSAQTAGQPLCGRHVHFTVFQIDRDTISGGTQPPTENGDYEPYVTVFGRPELVPTFCTQVGLREPVTGETHVAAACP